MSFRGHLHQGETPRVGHSRWQQGPKLSTFDHKDKATNVLPESDPITTADFRLRMTLEPPVSLNFLGRFPNSLR